MSPQRDAPPPSHPHSSRRSCPGIPPLELIKTTPCFQVSPQGESLVLLTPLLESSHPEPPSPRTLGRSPSHHLPRQPVLASLGRVGPLLWPHRPLGFPREWTQSHGTEITCGCVCVHQAGSWHWTGWHQSVWCTAPSAVLSSLSPDHAISATGWSRSQLC